MITIPVAVCGDDWVNRDQVKDLLYNSDHVEPFVLDLLAEGPSLYALGVVDVILKYLYRSNRSPAEVSVTNWSNNVESIPFERRNRHLLSHFFWMSKNYQPQVINHRTTEFLFGYFVGRRTVPRCVMLQEIQQHYPQKFLLSLMNTVADFKMSGLEPLSEWTNPAEFNHWWHHASIPSLDNVSVRDQFRGVNTNGSLLQWYPKFDIELVAETYTHGNTFFVTEKTVRPIVAGKSMLIFGPANYLARLRDLGFQTWHSIWDESYDTQTGPARWQLMQQVVKDLTSRNQDTLYQQCADIVAHNQQHANILIQKYQPQ